MKKLYEFTILKETEVDEVTVSKDEKGQETKTITKVKKPVSHRFFILKPGRAMIDEADLFYGVKLSEGITAGLITRQQLAKRYENDGGAMSEPEKEEYATLYVSLFEKQNEYQRLAGLKTEAERSEEEKAQLKTITEEMIALRRRIQTVEFDQVSLFDKTAESRARNKTILWWILYLAYKVSENGKEEPVFGGETYDTRLEKYYEALELEDEFMTDVVNKFMYFISFWYMGRATKTEDFAALEKDSETQETKAPETK